MTIREVLKKQIEKLNNNKIEDSVKKARILLAHTMGTSKEYLVINSNEELDNNIINEYEKNINQLINNIPLQYITNHQEFMKLDFYVDENVLIPRADTETLVEEVINKCNKNVEKNYKILDLCTGSGIVGISIAKYVKNSQVIASDISKNALEIAKKNAISNEVDNIKFIQSNCFKNIIDKFDIIISNPPYIKRDVIQTLEKEVQKEPIIALDGGIDGLDFYKIIIKEAPNYLKENGNIFLEIGYDQKDAVIKLIENDGRYNNIYSKKDLCGNDRLVSASII